MSINFPNAPAINATFLNFMWDGEKWVLQGGSGGGGGATVLVADTPPANVPDNSLWWESDSGVLYIRYNDGDSSQWVVAVPQLDAGSFMPATTPVVRYDVQTLTSAQQDQARQNINADGALSLKTSAYTISPADHNAIIDCSGTFTLSFGDLSRFTNRFKVRISNTGGGIITLDRGTAAQIDGGASKRLWPWQSLYAWTDTGSWMTTGGGMSSVMTYTPVVSASTGTITTYTSQGRYFVIGSLCHYFFSVTVSNNGTGAGALYVSLPIAPPSGTISGIFAGRENAVNGLMWQGLVSGSQLVCFNYQNNYTITNGCTLIMSGIYEIGP